MVALSVWVCVSFLSTKALQMVYNDSRFKVQGSLLFVTYTIIQGIISSEM